MTTLAEPPAPPRKTCQGCGASAPPGAGRCHAAACNLGLVVRVARRLLRTSAAVRLLGEDDAVGEGTLALVRASRGYRPERGFAFSTYAVTAIERAILRAAERLRPNASLAADPPARAENDFSGPDPAARAELRRLFAALRPCCRLVVRRLWLEGATVEEVAKEQRRSKARVRQVAREAMEALRRHGAGQSVQTHFGW